MNNNLNAVPNQYQQFNVSAQSGYVPVNGSTNIQEPSLLGRAQEAINRLESLEGNISGMRGNLFGEGEEAGPQEPSPSSLEGMLSEICARLASLVGDTGSINSRLAR